MIRLLALLLFSFVGFTSYSQQSNLNDSKRYIKIVLDNEINQEQQHEITAAFKQLNGIQTSRMDNTTNVFLGIYSTHNTNISDQTFLNWFANHGYSVNCYYDASYTEGAMIELSKNTCR